MTYRDAKDLEVIPVPKGPPVAVVNLHHGVIGGPDEVRALMDDLECLHLNMDQSANAARRELSWELMLAAFEFGLIERDEADDSPKPKEFGGAKALAKLLIDRIRRDADELQQLREEVRMSEERTIHALLELERRLTENIEAIVASEVRDAKERHQ